jgi:hypothetical protein
MNDSVFLGFVVVAIILFALMTVSIFRLKREHKILKQAVQALTEQIQRSSDDVAGLCSAAVAVDRRLSVYESCLRDMQKSVESQQAQAVFQPEYDRESIGDVENEEPKVYEKAIERIRRGSTIDELVRSCGLTRDEAVLLMRLHADH